MHTLRPASCLVLSSRSFRGMRVIARCCTSRGKLQQSSKQRSESSGLGTLTGAASATWNIESDKPGVPPVPKQVSDCFSRRGSWALAWRSWRSAPSLVQNDAKSEFLHICPETVVPRAFLPFIAWLLECRLCRQTLKTRRVYYSSHLASIDPTRMSMIQMNPNACSKPISFRSRGGVHVRHPGSRRTPPEFR